MTATKDEAITLKRLDYSETSQVLVFLTREHGPRRLIAKGIKRATKKQASTSIDLLERGQLMFISRAGSASSLGTLTEWRQLNAYLGLRTDLLRMYAAQYAAEITAAMTEEADPHPELYEGLCRLLETLSTGAGPLSALVAYQCVLLQAAGLWPDLGRCMLCGKEAPPGRAGYFAPHHGGLVCRECEPSVPEKRKVTGTILDALRVGDEFDPVAQGSFELLNYTISHHMGHAPVSARFMLDALRKAR